MKKIKKYVFLLISVIILIFIFSFLLKLRKVSDLSENCLTESFNREFENIGNLKLNSEYRFDQIFKCKDWDDIMIVQAPYVNRTLIYIMSGGVLLPEYEYINASDNSYFMFFIKSNNVINNPIAFGDPYFIFFQDFNNFNYIKINKENTNFVYKKFKNDDFDLYTLKPLSEE